MKVSGFLHVNYLTTSEVLLLHARIVQTIGGAKGVRDVGLIESSLARPRAAIGNEDLYPDLWSKAAAMMRSFVNKRAFVDGNKRTAFSATELFLNRNGYELNANHRANLEFLLQVTEDGIELWRMAAWLESHSHAMTSY